MSRMSAAAKLCTGLALVGLQAACAMKPPTEAASRDDPFRPYREVETAAYRIGVNPGTMTLRLAAHIDRATGAATTLVKVHHHYLGQHKFIFETARNARAEALKLTVVARYGNCNVRTSCPLDELYTVEVPEADLRAAARTVYQFKVFPRVGADIVVTVPAEMIGALLGLVDQDRARAAAPPKSMAKAP